MVSREFRNWLKWISLRVRQAREQAGLTQEALGERAGLPDHFIPMVEAGRHYPSYKARLVIARGCGVEPSFLEPQEGIDQIELKKLDNPLLAPIDSSLGNRPEPKEPADVNTRFPYGRFPDFS